MTASNFDIERSMARCRVFLSLIASLAFYVDPTIGGALAIDRYWGGVLVAHFAYSTSLLAAHGRFAPAHLATIATVGDVLFAAAIAMVTEGTTSPFYSFFTFAVLTVGMRSGLRAAQDLYLGMRAAYIAITGFLVGYFGEQRLKQDALIRTFEAGAQREQIARSLHDGYVQALSGINLRLETMRELSRRGRHEEVQVELADLQQGVNREHDDLRRYIRSLIDLEATSPPSEPGGGTQVSVRGAFQGPAPFVEHVLLLMLEGTRNVRRHARARVALLDVHMTEGELVLTVDDDGVGFGESAEPSWSMLSRVAECGGRLTLPKDGRAGGHVLIQLPVT